MADEALRGDDRVAAALEFGYQVTVPAVVFTENPHLLIHSGAGPFFVALSAPSLTGVDKLRACGHEAEF